MRLGVVVVLAVLAAAAADDARATVPAWSMAHVMRAIDGKRVSVGERRVRIVTESTLCGGEGPSVRSGGVRKWRRFICTYTTFSASGIERDLEFRVRIVSAQRLAIANAHWVTGP